MAITEDILVRLRVQGQQQFASAMGGAATQTGRLGTVAGTTGKRVDDTGKKAKTAAGRLQGFGGGVAKFAAATGAVYAAQKVVTDAVSNAVNLGEQINKTAVVFRGPGAKAVQAWSKTTATGIGISQRAALEAAGTFGNMLVPMGLGRKEAAGMSTRMVNLAGDMASFNNASPEETLEALRAGISGETEPLRRFGVRLSQARIEEQAMRMGLKKGKGDLTDHARALATQALILKDTKDAHGDFGRTSDSLANKQRILKAQYEEATAALGEKLIPVLAAVVGNLDVVAVVVGAVALAWIAWGAGAIIAAAGTTTLSGAVGALTAAILANPIGLIAIALIALVAGLIIAYKKWGAFRNVVDAVASFLGGALKAAFNWLKGAIPKVWAVLKNAPLIWIIRNFGKIKNAAVTAFNWIKRAATNTWANMKKGASMIWNWIKNAAKDAAKFVTNAWGTVIRFFRGLPGKIKSAASGMWDGIKSAFRGAINAVIGWWNGLELTWNLPDFLPGVPGEVTLSTPNIGTLASGGPAAAGRPYVVGEQGPELFVPGASGTVLPNGAGGAIHTHVYLNGREIATAVGNAAADRRARR